MDIVNALELEGLIKGVYRRVALEPHGRYHFETGRNLALRLGYPPELLERVPVEAVESFAGVGYHFDLADLKQGEHVLDLGSGSGMDSFVALELAGAAGRIVGVDMTAEQLAKAERLRDGRFENATFREGRIEALPFESASFDAVISNGVINLVADKARAFGEIGRVLRPGGRMAISDIVSTKPLSAAIVCDATLWASCIGGAMQEDSYRRLIEAAEMRIAVYRENRQYEFLSESAREASVEFGVKSISLLARKD